MKRRGLLYFMSPGDNPRERQLYLTSLDRTMPPFQVTQGAGWHNVTMAEDASVFLDSFSNTDDTAVAAPAMTPTASLISALVPNTLEGRPSVFPLRRRSCRHRVRDHQRQRWTGAALRTAEAGEHGAGPPIPGDRRCLWRPGRAAA